MAHIGLFEQLCDLLGDRHAVSERRQASGPVAQQFLGVPIGGRNDRNPQSRCVGQGAGRDLGRIQIRREVDVGRLQIFNEPRRVGVFVDQPQVALDPQFAGQLDKTLPVAFAFFGDEMRMGGAQDGVDDVRSLLDDSGQRSNDVLQPLVGREQAEREQHKLSRSQG